MKIPNSKLSTTLIGSAILLVQTVSAQIIAEDNFEDAVYSTMDFGDNGGSGLGGLTYLEGSDGGIFAETGGRVISGTRSLGIWAGDASSGGDQAVGRSLDTPTVTGTISLDLSFDLPNGSTTFPAHFAGFNLQSSLPSPGTGAFGINELLSVGVSSSTGGNSIHIGGSAPNSIDLGSPILGSIVSLEIDFDAAAGTYTVGAKLNSSTTFTTASGNLQASSTQVGAIGWGNFNDSGSDTIDLITDNLSIVPEPASYAMIGGLLSLGMVLLRRRIQK